MGAIDSWWIAIGIFAGMFFGMIFIATGFIAGYKDDRSDKGHNQGKLQDSDSADDLLHKRSGDRSGNNRCNTSPEEIVLVLKFLLHTYRHNLSQHEKDCIEKAIADYESEPKTQPKPHTLEEKIMTLNAFRTDATEFEKCVLDEISDDLIELDARRFVEHPFYEYELDDETDSEPCPMGFCPWQE